MSDIILKIRLREPDENGMLSSYFSFPTLKHVGEYISALEGPSMPSAKITINYVDSDDELS